MKRVVVSSQGPCDAERRCHIHVATEPVLCVLPQRLPHGQASVSRGGGLGGGVSDDALPWHDMTGDGPRDCCCWTRSWHVLRQE